MGKALEQAVILDKELELAGIWRRGGDINELLSRADILIDFSLPDANEVIVNAVIKNNTPLAFKKRESVSPPSYSAIYARPFVTPSEFLRQPLSNTSLHH